MTDPAPPTGPTEPAGDGSLDPTTAASAPTDSTAVAPGPADPTTPRPSGPAVGPPPPWTPPPSGPAVGPPPPWTPPSASGAPSGPYGQGWADDGSYLPPPDPSAPAPTAGWGQAAGPQPPTAQAQQGYGQGGYAPSGQPGAYAQQPVAGYGQQPPGGGPPPGVAVAPGGLPPLGWVTTPWGPRWRGPIGTPKSTGITILLSIITCGIWTWVWSYQTHEDLKRYRGDGLGGAVGLLLAVVVNVAVMFTAPMEIEQMYQEEGLQSPVSTMDGLWFLLPIAGPFVWYAKVQRALNDFWVARGAAPA